MPWTRLDDGFHSHPKVLGLSDVAYRLHVQSLNWAVARSTDGKVPEIALVVALPAHRPRQREQAAVELESAGLWIRNGVGWYIHDFEDYQDTKADLEARRQKWASQKRGQRSGVHRGHSEDSSTTQPNPTHPIENYLDPQRGLTLAIEEAAKDPKVRNPEKAGRYRFRQDPIKYNARADLLETQLPETLRNLPRPEDLKAEAKRQKAELQRREGG
jgi:hypothetical protein